MASMENSASAMLDSEQVNMEATAPDVKQSGSLDAFHKSMVTDRRVSLYLMRHANAYAMPPIVQLTENDIPTEQRLEIPAKSAVELIDVDDDRALGIVAGQRGTRAVQQRLRELQRIANEQKHLLESLMGKKLHHDHELMQRSRDALRKAATLRAQIEEQKRFYWLTREGVRSREFLGSYQVILKNVTVLAFVKNFQMKKMLRQLHNNMVEIIASQLVNREIDDSDSSSCRFPLRPQSELRHWLQDARSMQRDAILKTPLDSVGQSLVDVEQVMRLYMEQERGRTVYWRKLAHDYFEEGNELADTWQHAEEQLENVRETSKALREENESLQQQLQQYKHMWQQQEYSKQRNDNVVIRLKNVLKTEHDKQQAAIVQSRSLAHREKDIVQRRKNGRRRLTRHLNNTHDDGTGGGPGGIGGGFGGFRDGDSRIGSRDDYYGSALRQMKHINNLYNTHGGIGASIAKVEAAESADAHTRSDAERRNRRRNQGRTSDSRAGADDSDRGGSGPRRLSGGSLAALPSTRLSSSPQSPPASGASDGDHRPPPLMTTSSLPPMSSFHQQQQSNPQNGVFHFGQKQDTSFRHPPSQRSPHHPRHGLQHHLPPRPQQPPQQQQQQQLPSRDGSNGGAFVADYDVMDLRSALTRDHGEMLRLSLRPVSPWKPPPASTLSQAAAAKLPGGFAMQQKQRQQDGDISRGGRRQPRFER